MNHSTNTKRLAELEAISPFRLTVDELFELLELYGFTPAVGGAS